MRKIAIRLLFLALVADWTLVQSTGTSNHYCGLSNACDGRKKRSEECQSGWWKCNYHCGGEWCEEEEKPTPAPSPAPLPDEGYCSWQQCDGQAQGSFFCNSNRASCEWACLGEWCDSLESRGPGQCPPSSPNPGDFCTVPSTETCAYGTETCCGQTYDSLICNCDDGHWSCVNSDACLRPACPPTPSPTPPPTDLDACKHCDYERCGDPRRCLYDDCEKDENGKWTCKTLNTMSTGRNPRCVWDRSGYWDCDDCNPKRGFCCRGCTYHRYKRNLRRNDKFVSQVLSSQ